MPSARLRAFRFTWQLAVVLLVGGVLVVACGSNKLTDSGGNGGPSQGDSSIACTPGHQGCPCDSQGQTVACGEVKESFGSYVTCEEGNSICTNGTWGPCVGDTTVVAQSLGGATLGANGIRVLTVTGSCASTSDGGTYNPCDPNCVQQSDGPNDVPDGAPVLVTEAGVTLPPTTTQSGGGGDGGACSGLGCQVDWACPTKSPTTLTGKVYDPAGNNPLYDAYVYIPVDPNPADLPAFTSGVTCDTCAGAGNLNAVAVAQTDPTGAFTLTNVPSQQYGAGNPIPLVIQMGKWRRVTMLPSYAPCTSTAVASANSRLPRNQTDGYNNHADLPQVAFVSGSADPFECMLLKAGIDPNEFGSSSLNSTRRFHYYNSPDSAGDSISSTYGNVVTGDKMWNNTNSPWNLSAYDVVILACEGAEYDGTDRTTNGYQNLINYTSAGGRVFMSHFSYVWMKYNQPWTNVVGGWGSASTTATQDPLNATIYTTGFAKGQAFQTWLGDTPNPNALSGGTLPIHQARQDFAGGLAATAQPWMTATNTSGAFGTCSATSCGQGSDCNTGVCNNDANSGTCGCYQSSDCSSMSAGTCSGGGLGACSVKSCVLATDCTSGSCGGSTLGKCSCYKSSECSGGGTCSVGAKQGTCSAHGNAACDTTANCHAGDTCIGAIAGTCSVATCGTASSCAATGATCTGAVQGSCSCETSSQCSGGGTCNGAKVGQCSTASCAESSECTSGNGVCTGGTLGTCTCGSNNDCPGSTNTCQGSGAFDPAFTFNTPLTAPPANQCGRAVFTDFHVATSAQESGSGSCYSASDCGYGATCTGGTLGACSDPSCSTSADCGDPNWSCNGATVGVCQRSACTNTLQTVVNCASGVCSQSGGSYVCGCTTSADCTETGKGTCNAGVCTYTQSCTQSKDCRGPGESSDASCVGGQCVRTVCKQMEPSCGSGVCATVGGQSVCGCDTNADCGVNGTCNTTTHVCTLGSCTGSPTCYSGSAETGDAVCNGGSYGTCAPNTCTSVNQCAATSNGQEQCNGTNCGACRSTKDCPASGASCTGAKAGTCSGSTSTFPNECIQGLLDSQEAALEFMFFDLSACVSPDNQPPPGPPVPVTSYNPATFTVDFPSTCPSGTIVRWRELDWQATIPSTASIVFSAQTAATAVDGGWPSFTGVQSVALATATTTTPNLPSGWSSAIMDTSNASGQGGSGLFNTASPAVVSKADLLVTITLNPTTDKSAAPTLIQWQVKSDCIPSE